MANFVIIWRFNAKQGSEEEFEQLYGTDGVWCTLFRSDSNYLGTKLMRDAIKSNQYVTCDYWSSQNAYEGFRARHKEAYEAIDLRCESVTELEQYIGAFLTVD